MIVGFPLFFARVFGKSWQTPHLRIIYFHDVPRESLGRFTAILDHFSKLFEFVPYSRGIAMLLRNEIQRPTMVVTFDDANEGVYENALPILAARGITACVFTVADYVRAGRTYREKHATPVMNWRMLERCLEEGWEIGNHTYSHRNLVTCSRDEILREVENNRKCLESQLKCAVVHFAYPYGQFTPQTINVIRDSGLCDTQATTQRGQMRFPHDPHFIRRDRIDMEKTPDRIEVLMRLADRLYWMRHVRKFLRKK